MMGINKSIFAGIFISMGCMAYLNVGGLFGAVLFAFGLITIISYGCLLFTGTAGFIEDWKDGFWLLVTLILNVFGCTVAANMFNITTPELAETAISIIEKRISHGCLNCFILAIACGMVMTAAVYFAKLKNNWLPLIFGIPLFIMCGFTHCIADAFYFFVAYSHNYDYLNIYYDEWLFTVAGNFIGCNLWRLHVN